MKLKISRDKINNSKGNETISPAWNRRQESLMHMYRNLKSFFFFFFGVGGEGGGGHGGEEGEQKLLQLVNEKAEPK